MPRSIVKAAAAVIAAVVAAGLAPAADADLHARYAQLLAGPSATQRLVLVAADDAATLEWGAPPWADDRRAALAQAIDRGGPRLVIWPEEHVPGDSSQAPLGVDPIAGPPLVRARDPGFPAAALAALGQPARAEALPVRFASRLPTVPARRVVAGEIPASTFRDRVVVVGRTDAAALTVATPLGLMSPAQVEAHALLGVLDGATWAPLPVWLRLLALGMWALAVVAALRGRGFAATVAIAAAACVAAVGLDALLFAAGVARLGAAAAVLVALAAAALQIAGMAAQALTPAELGDHLDGALTTTASGLHKVSGM